AGVDVLGCCCGNRPESSALDSLACPLELLRFFVRSEGGNGKGRGAGTHTTPTPTEPIVDPVVAPWSCWPWDERCVFHAVLATQTPLADEWRQENCRCSGDSPLHPFVSAKPGDLLTFLVVRLLLLLLLLLLSSVGLPGSRWGTPGMQCQALLLMLFDFCECLGGFHLVLDTIVGLSKVQDGGGLSLILACIFSHLRFLFGG
ncbi:unnamed protein product, partial [Ectocarpus sp. 8 AP-2014]